MENGQLQYFIIKELFVEFKPYQNKIADSISKSKLQLTLAHSVYLTNMYKANPEIMSQMLDRLKSASTLKENLYNKITENKD